MEAPPTFKSDSALIRRRTEDRRSDATIVREYLLERHLSDQLRAASPEARGAVYASAYKAFYESISLNDSGQARAHRNQVRLKALRGLLSPQTVFVEVGAGDGSFAKLVAPHVKIAYAVDVQDVSADLADRPENFVFLKESGSLIPMPDASADLIFSDQFMEHLHPDDARRQLSELVRVLRPGGKYYCITPSRATGPHDNTGYFDDVAKGFHLKEYDYREMDRFFRAGGFSRVEFLASGAGLTFPMPFFLGRWIDSLLLGAPQGWRRRLRHFRVVRGLAGLTAIGVK